MPANLTEFRDSSGVDVSDKYVSTGELQQLQSYLTEQGITYYNAAGLWSWGNNSSGQLGLGSADAGSASPIQVGSLTDWSQVSAGGAGATDSALAIKTDGTLWAWGYNVYGQLGLGDTTKRSSPVQVGSLTNWKQVSLSYESSLAIKTDGTLWACGSNSFGQLGLGNTTNVSSPVQVGSLTDWSQVSAGYAHTLAIKTDGTLWAWGNNYGGNAGNLGLNDTTKRSSPVQVGSLTNWKRISCANHSIAIKTDGTLWAWGSNITGGLGLTDFANRSSPVQVGTANNWNNAWAGGGRTLATKTDNSLWVWGRNSSGALGLGDTVHTNSPIQLGALTNWKQISADLYYDVVCAVKTDGTLWTWGSNNSGQLGLGDITNRSSPVQVGSLTNWKQVESSSSATYAIK